MGEIEGCRQREVKLCIKCDVLLDGSNTTWYRQKNHIHKCNDCTRVEKRDQARLRDKSVTNTNTRKHLAKLKAENPKKYTARQQYSSAQKRAIALGLPFDITTKYIEGIAPDMCPVLGLTLKYGGGGKTLGSASVDRIDPQKGYVQGNVQIVSNLANVMKSNATPEQLLAFAEWIVNTYRSGVQTDKIG